jgi:hypothetical protein
MARTREIEMAHLTHMVEYIDMFLRRHSRPRQRYEKLEEAREEVEMERLLLKAEIEGAPGLRRNNRNRKKESDL